MPPKNGTKGSNKASGSGGGKVSDEHRRKQLSRLDNPSLHSSSSSSSLRSRESHDKPEASGSAPRSGPPKRIDGIEKRQLPEAPKDIPKAIEVKRIRTIVKHDTLIELVDKFCAGFLAIQKGIELINAACKEHPERNPFGDAASLSKRCGSLNKSIADKRHYARLIGDNDILENQMQFRHKTETHDEHSKTLNRWKTEECNLHKTAGIKFFFVEAPKFLDELIKEMKGDPPGVSRQLFHPWSPDTAVYAKDTSKSKLAPPSNSVYVWSRLTLEPIIRNFFCLPVMSLNREASLWYAVVIDRFREFYHLKISLKKIVGYALGHEKAVEKMANRKDVKTRLLLFKSAPEDFYTDLVTKGRNEDYRDSWRQMEDKLHKKDEAKSMPSHIKKLVSQGTELEEKVKPEDAAEAINKLCEDGKPVMDDAISNLKGAIQMHQQKKQEAKAWQEEQDRLLAEHLAREEGGTPYPADDPTDPFLSYNHPGYGSFGEM